MYTATLQLVTDNAVVTEETAWYTIASGVSSLVAVLGALAALALWVARKVSRSALYQGFTCMVRDWQGYPARPGYPAIPGMPERVHRLEQASQKQGERLSIVEHEVTPNSGQSLKDIVLKTHLAVEHMVAQQDGGHNGQD